MKTSQAVHSKVLLLSASILALCVPNGAAFSQENTEIDETARLDVVTVTATKRETTLEETPIAVSVVNGADIARAEIQDLKDLQTLVPSLRVSQRQNTVTTNFTIRGYGNGANNFGLEPSVGVFIDGVYRSRSAAQLSDLPNLKRVEVLRGPQSTLFGKNASIGVISVVTAEPEFDYSGYVSGTVANYDTLRGRAFVTGPISEQLAFSLGGTIHQSDSYGTNLETGSQVNERDRWGLRGQLLFKPQEDFKIRLIGDYDKIDEVCCVVANLVNGPTGGAIEALGGVVAEMPFSYDVKYNFDPNNAIENSGLSAQVDWSINDRLDLTSITAVRKNEVETDLDGDFTAADLVGVSRQNIDIDTFTQEVRLTYELSDRANLLLGGFYFDETITARRDFQWGGDFRAFANILSNNSLGTVEQIIAGPNAVGTLFLQEGQGVFEDFAQENTSWSVFGTLDYELTDRLTFSAGLSYIEDEKTVDLSVDSTDVFSAVDLVAVGVAIGVPPTLASNPDVNPFLGLQQLQILPPLLSVPNAVEDGRSNDSDTTYSLRLSYDLTDNVNVYASTSTGFKATSWNLTRDSRPFATDFISGSPAALPAPASSPIRDAGLALPNLVSGTRFAGPESVTVYELGVKGRWDTVSASLAIFDQQVDGFQSVVFNGTGFVLANAGEQSVAGAELETRWRPTDALTLNFSATYLDPVFDSFTGSIIGDVSGQRPPNIPEWSSTLGANYTFSLLGGTGYVSGDWQYQSETDFFLNPATQALLGENYSVNTVNASMGLEYDSGWSVSLWGRNIFDDEYITGAFTTPVQSGSLSGYPSAPPTYGVTLKRGF